MLAFLARRLLAPIPVMLMVAVLVFLMLRLTPGDPAAIMAGDNASSAEVEGSRAGPGRGPPPSSPPRRPPPADPAAIMAGDSASSAEVEVIRAGLGLDRPLPVQFAIWFGDLLRGDLGESFFFKRPVTDLILQRVGPTLSLATTTIILAVLVAVPLGVLAAWRHGTIVDRLVSGFAVLGFSVPVFVLGYTLIYVFAIRLNWLPVQGYKPLSAGFGPFLYQLVLPSLTLSVIYIALIARIQIGRAGQR